MKKPYDIDADIAALYEDKRFIEEITNTGLADKLSVVFGEHITSYERELIGIACDESWWSMIKHFKRKIYVKALLDITHRLKSIVDGQANSLDSVNKEILKKKTLRSKYLSRTPFRRGTSE